MKLKRFQLIDGGANDTKRYKSLQPFNQEFVISTDGQTEINPIALVGVNGSGKSNLLELIAEVFFYLESFYLQYVPKSYQKRFKIQFEIEYILNNGNEAKTVKIIKRLNKGPEYFCTSLEAQDARVTDIEVQKELLPKRIVGYSSGLNETLSIPFKTIRALYADEVGLQANPKSRTKLSPKDLISPRLMYMDNETNEFILVSNFLFKSESQLRVFRESLRIESLYSFRLIIQFGHTAAPKGGILRTKELDSLVDRLVKCSSSFVHDEDQEIWILDYFNCDATRDAFVHHFDTPQNLFEALYKLSLLNPLCVRGRDNRKWAISNDIFPPDKAFRVEEIKLKISHPNDIISYRGISDGEHQFMHILGSSMLFDEENLLYLFDEPETHFNPKWRAKFITLLRQVLNKPCQEFIITTHSPFILSDVRGYNVFVFLRENDKVWFEEIGFETFGSSFQVLLKKAFGRDVQVSELALQEIKDLLENVDDVGSLVAGASKLGESFEKQFVLEKINQTILRDKN